MHYDWGAAKSAWNLRHRDLDFQDAVRSFDGPVLQCTRLPQSYPERRVMAVGILDGREIVAVYTQRSRRIISARRAKRKERRLYAEAYPSLADD
jgi:uncharacterized protein